GSVAFDSVQTPTAERENVIGGSATVFSWAASYFTPVHPVGVGGDGWPRPHTEPVSQQSIKTASPPAIPAAKTFRWKGKYLPNMNDRETLEVHLNVFETFDPKVPPAFRDCKYVFLANGSPIVQMKVLDQMPDARLKVADTMDLWINLQRD